MTFSFQEIQRLKTLSREKLDAEHWTNLGHMVEVVARQVRNPIASIGKYTHGLLKALPGSQKGQTHLTRILRETRKLETMLEQVEEYIQTPKLSLQKEKVQEVVEVALQTFSKEAKKKDVLFNLEATGLKGDGYFFIDRDRMVEALFRIFENSVDAVTSMPSKNRGAIVRVAILEDEERLGISVSDQGQGIPKKNLGLIFEPFFSTRPDRVGLGLTFVKRVIEEHGGQIRIESRPKKGTTIALYFQKDRRRRVRRELFSS